MSIQFNLRNKVTNFFPYFYLLTQENRKSFNDQGPMNIFSLKLKVDGSLNMLHHPILLKIWCKIS
jgi:hypothetical protein